MSTSRLTQALETDAVTLPAGGRIVVLGPRAGTDLSALPLSRTQVIQGFRPDHDVFVAAGFDTGTEPQGAFTAAVVYLPRAKAQARAMIAQASALTDGGMVIIDGQKTDGIESVLKDCRKCIEVAPVISKAHGKLFAFTGGDFADWASESGGQTIAEGFVTAPGVFSADAPDPGSVTLAAALPADLPKNVADLGAGWGYLSRAILERKGVKTLHLVEADHAALECARRNIEDDRAQFHWADALQFRPDTPLDAVITNPPFHNSRSADPDIGRSFIAAAANMLKPSGRLYLVANRHLPYESEAEKLFQDVREIAGDRSFKILLAAKPRRNKR